MDTALAFVGELEARDTLLAGRLELFTELGRRVDELKERVGVVGDLLARLPRDREHVETMRVQAERDLHEAGVALEEARRTLESARGEDALAAARRQESAADNGARSATERNTRLLARRQELEREEVAAGEEIGDLGRRAEALTEELNAAPRIALQQLPNPGLDGLVDWVARAQVAVFVARSGLQAERERVVREANELAASVLDEPLSAASVAVIRKRLEEARA